MDAPVQGTKIGEDCYKVGSVTLNNIKLVSLLVNGEERVCLAQLSNTMLKDYSYNEIHNRRVALGITCVQCTPLQLEVLRRSGAMPMSSRRCGMITRREAERLFKSFFNDISPPNLPSDFVFSVYHECGWGCTGIFIPSKYNSSRAKCIQCTHCSAFFSPNKFIFHCHETGATNYIHPDAANFNSWRRHIQLTNQSRSKDIEYAWEDVKALFNGGSRKRLASPPPRAAQELLPSKLLSNMYSTPRTEGHKPPMCSALSSAIPSNLRLPTPNLTGFPTGFPSQFFRASVPVEAALQPMWSPSHHFALNELLHGSRLLVPGFAAHPTFSQYQLNRSRASLSLNTRSITHKVESSSGFSSGSTSNVPGEAATSNNNSHMDIKDKKIKRPWIDNTQQNNEHGNNPDITEVKSAVDSLGSHCASSITEGQVNNNIIRSLLHHIEHPVIL